MLHPDHLPPPGKQRNRMNNSVPVSSNGFRRTFHRHQFKTHKPLLVVITTESRKSKLMHTFQRVFFTLYSVYVERWGLWQY